MPNIDARRWSEIRAVFDEVVELDLAQRNHQLATIALSDPELRRQVETLLSADAQLTEDLAEIEEMFTPRGDGDDPQIDPDPLNITGQTISHFRIGEAVAAGGMGVVYRAEDTNLRRAIALKFPLPAGHIRTDFRERFLHEARSAAALDHPNICSIYEAGATEDGRLFLAMPLYDGETLKARLARQGPIAIPEAMSIAAQITEGVRAAHRAGIIHRDLKPANVMLLPDGSVKLLDFGLAKVRDLSLTASHTRIGTVSYMSPEQIQGVEVDGRSDLWAIGVMLYEMLTGRRPFDGEYDVSIAHAIVHSEPLRVSTWCPQIESDGEELVATLLHKDPALRYASADQLAAQLADFSGKVPAHSPPASAPAAWRRHRRLPRVRAIPAAAAILVIVAGVSAALFSTIETGASAARTIAVLPFRTTNGDTAADYLSAGISDALAVDLSRLQSVIVPSAVSLSKYSESTGPLPEVAKELGAAAVVHAAVRRVGDRLRIDVQLADSVGDRKPWTRSYDRPVSELIGMQSAVLTDLISALRLRVSDEERARLRRTPTTDTEAYELYLRGRASELRAGTMSGTDRREAMLLAQSYYARARDLDPDYALARARLALTYGRDASASAHSEAKLDQARVEAETALRIDPDLPEAHEALAWYWGRGKKDSAKAVEEMELAIRGSPNNAYYRLMLGDSYRRQGRWEEAVEQFERAMQIEPRSSIHAASTALTYSRMRRYKEAVGAWNRAIELEPDNALFMIIRGHVFIRWQGTVDTLAAAVRAIPHNVETDGMITNARFHLARVQRQWQAALAAVNEALTESTGDDMFYRPRSLMRAQAYDALGDQENARSHYETARALLADSLANRPNDERMHIALGLVYAGLGSKSEAVAAARRAMELVPLAQNSAGATSAISGAVEIFVRTGDNDTALELLELLFSIPAGREVSVPLLRVDPIFDPLRSDPRFQQLLQRFSD